MLILLVSAVGLASIATCGVVGLLSGIQQGVIRGKYGHRTHRSREPLSFWLSILLWFVIILSFYYFALMMFIAAFNTDR